MSPDFLNLALIKTEVKIRDHMLFTARMVREYWENKSRANL